MIHTYVIDLSKPESIKKTIQPIVKKHSAPDLLINNASIIEEPMPFHEMDTHRMTEIIQTNLIGTLNISQQVMKAMIEKWINWKIVTIWSTAALYPYTLRSTYALCKHALKARIESISGETNNNW